MHLVTKLTVFATVALAASITGAANAADAFPEKPITLVVPFSAGGATDMISRMVAEEISDSLDTPVIVENKPGAGGNIGARYVAQAKPDGYTIVMGTLGTQVTNELIFDEVPYDARKDFTPISLVAFSPNVMLVSKDYPVKNVKELIDTAKNSDVPLQFASTSLGSSPHLSGELFNMLTGVSMEHIPYSGGGEA